MGEAPRQALQLQLEVGEFFGAERFVPVTNVHMMGDVEVMGDSGLRFMRDMAGLGARCVVNTTTNARCFDFAPKAIVFGKTNPVMVQGAVFAGITITEGWSEDPSEVFRTGDTVRVDPQRKRIDVLKRA